MNKLRVTNGEIFIRIMILCGFVLFTIAIIIGTARIPVGNSVTDSNLLEQRLLGNCEHTNTRLEAIERVIEQNVGIQICGE